MYSDTTNFGEGRVSIRVRNATNKWITLKRHGPLCSLIDTQYESKNRESHNEIANKRTYVENEQLNQGRYDLTQDNNPTNNGYPTLLKSQDVRYDLKMDRENTTDDTRARQGHSKNYVGLCNNQARQSHTTCRPNNCAQCNIPTNTENYRGTSQSTTPKLRCAYDSAVHRDASSCWATVLLSPWKSM